MIVDAPNETAMEALGARVALAAAPGFTLFLSGELGVGKTTLTRGFLRALGHTGAVKSPTYTLVEPYQLATSTVYHFDFYRLSDAEELEFMGIRDYFGEQAICVVEWPERAADRLPRPDLILAITYGEPGRQISIIAETSAGDRAAACLAAHQR